MSLLSFLKGAKVEEVAAPVKGTGGVRKQWNPNPGILAIRLWYSGAIFPSQALVDKFNLEYPKGVVEEIPAKEAVGTPGTEGYVAGKEASRRISQPEASGNGFDVIDSDAWQAYKGEGRMLFVSPVAKNQPKVDLFGSTTYEDDGTPKSTVMDQGSVTFGKETLLPLVKEIYGVELAKSEEGKDNKEYVDLLVVSQLGDLDIVSRFSSKLLYAPKKISRGEDKGKPTYEIRENAAIYLLAPAEEVGLAAGVEQEEAPAKPEPGTEGGKLEIEEPANLQEESERA